MIQQKTEWEAMFGGSHVAELADLRWSQTAILCPDNKIGLPTSDA